MTLLDEVNVRRCLDVLKKRLELISMNSLFDQNFDESQLRDCLDEYFKSTSSISESKLGDTRKPTNFHLVREFNKNGLVVFYENQDGCTSLETLFPKKPLSIRRIKQWWKRSISGTIHQEIFIKPTTTIKYATIKLTINPNTWSAGKS